MKLAIYAIITISYFISFWKLFEKAGRKPWEGVVPFYNIYIWLKILKRPLAATAIMMWAIVLGDQIGLLAALIFGIAGYALALWLLRIFGDEEKRIVASLLPEQVAGRLPLNLPQDDE